MSDYLVLGMPGAQSAQTATARIVFADSMPPKMFPGGKVINGSLSRDSGNTGDLDVLRAGLLMGKITASGKFAPAVLGVTQGAYTSGGTSITVTAAQAVEIARRVGTSGNLTYVGPPSAAGTVAVTASIAFSAIDTSTGIITTSTLGVDKIAGTFVCSTDGSHVPRTLIYNGYGIKVTDSSSTSIDVPFALFPISGMIKTANVLPGWPSDTSLATWVRDSLKANGMFMFDDLLGQTS